MSAGDLSLSFRCLFGRTGVRADFVLSQKIWQRKKKTSNNSEKDQNFDFGSNDKIQQLICITIRLRHAVYKFLEQISLMKVDGKVVGCKTDHICRADRARVRNGLTSNVDLLLIFVVLVGEWSRCRVRYT